MNQPNILIAPHHFPDLKREEQLAAEFDGSLLVSRDQEEFSRLLPDADVVMVTPYVYVNRDDIGQMKTPAAIVRYGIGYDKIDVPSAVERGIPVSIVPDSSSTEVASHAFAMGIALTRRLPTGQEAISSGQWAGQIAYDSPPFDQLRVGIVGYGRIGRITAGFFESIGAQVSVYDPFVKDSSVATKELEVLLAESDLISLHLPLSSETRHLISHEQIALMQKHAAIVNVSRGGLINEEALVEALNNGHIAGAGLDSFEVEPLPGGHRLRTAKNVVLTPHIAWRSTVSGGALQSAAVSRARLALQGETMPDLVRS